MNDQASILLKKLNVTTPPIPVEEVAKFMSLRVVYYPGFPENISGTMIKEENLIGVNSNHGRHRQRFTIAHELGHYVLGHDDPKIIDDTFDKPTVKERDANKFAAELLIPADFLKNDIAHNEYDIPSLAKRYDVSEQAMTIRIMDLRLLDKIKPPKI